MSLLIKGMDMPKYGDTFKVYLDADGAFLLVDTNDSSRFYTLVEVKAPHGDLIDRDALDEAVSNFDWGQDSYWSEHASDLVNEAPTMIEAED